MVEQGSLDGDALLLAARLRAEADDHLGAARHLLEAGRAAVRRGAVASAESVLRRAKTLGVADQGLLADLEETLLQALGMAARTDDALPVGGALINACAC
ncbi:MAG: hypothetical protein M3378_01800 [Actinomycetota bacterium]|nr:hypothetical protein [Actinomycetota bacterium]